MRSWHRRQKWTDGLRLGIMSARGLIGHPRRFFRNFAISSVDRGATGIPYCQLGEMDFARKNQVRAVQNLHQHQPQNPISSVPSTRRLRNSNECGERQLCY